MKAVGILVLAALLLLPVLALPPWHKVIHSISRSSIRLPTSFHQPTKEVIWTHRTTENLMHIAKIQDDSMMDRLNSRYTVDNNGRTLCICNVTEYDNGEYIAEATLENGTIVIETFYLMDHENVKTRSHVPIIIYIIIVAAAAAFSVIVWMYLSKSGQDIAENKNLKSSIQDSESTFNNVSRGKTMKTKEEYEEQTSDGSLERPENGCPLTFTIQPDGTGEDLQGRMAGDPQIQVSNLEDEPSCCTNKSTTP
ncbi:uncharacterized protein [Dendrobates tinctorius]|uniref:uncharacterized protein isoform X2 n=1 Tax=Dendrobates tinctorius TaxID=92724 RepID=UPI003CC92851